MSTLARMFIAPSSSNSTVDICHHPSSFLLILAIILPVGCLASYLPQHYKIIARKSHIGLNFFCYCGLTLTNCCSMVAFLLLHWDETVGCCDMKVHTMSQCAYNTLRPLLFIVSFVCAAIIVILYVLYFNQEEEIRGDGSETWFKIRWKLFILIILCLGVIGSSLIVGLVIEKLQTNNSILKSFTAVLSVFAAIITSIHWMPQVIETWRLQSLGSLSLALLILQSFGCILTFVSVSKGGFIVGVPFLVASFMQYLLISLTLFFWCRDQKRGGRERELLQEPFFNNGGGDDDDKEQGVHWKSGNSL
jgi:uncharacterized protein with PQ loop repeat